MTLIDGKTTAKKIRENIKKEISQLDYELTLAVILIGDDPASQAYVNMKKKNCAEVGIKSLEYRYDKITAEELKSLIEQLNQDKNIDGILLQLPLPDYLAGYDFISLINPLKDVDCFHPENIGKLFSGNPLVKPCTPAGIIYLLKEYNIDIKGRKATIIGRSNIVGKPLWALLLMENATVTVCHSRTKDLKKECIDSEIVVVATGKPKLLTADMVKDGVIVIDVGSNRIDDDSEKGYHFEGDADFDEIKKKASYITPVPGGVGPMTRAMLLDNCIKLAKLRRQ